MSMTHDEMIAVITHHKNGGKVQGKANWTDKWTDLDEPTFNFTNLDYRAKPEPLVLWAEIKDGFVTAASLEQRIATHGGTIKKFIEQI